MATSLLSRKFWGKGRFVKKSWNQEKSWEITGVSNWRCKCACELDFSDHNETAEINVCGPLPMYMYNMNVYSLQYHSWDGLRQGLRPETEVIPVVNRAWKITICRPHPATWISFPIIIHETLQQIVQSLSPHRAVTYSLLDRSLWMATIKSCLYWLAISRYCDGALCGVRINSVFTPKTLLTGIDRNIKYRHLQFFTTRSSLA